MLPQSSFINQEFSCRIPHHKIVNKKIVYIVIFVSHSFCSAKVQNLRYSDAEKLHAKLEKSAQSLRISVTFPTFPGKKLFGSHNDSEQGIIRRRSDLQDYFNQLLKIDKLYALPQLKAMLPDINDDKSDLSQYLQDKPQQQYSFVIDSFQQLDMFVLYFVQVIDNFNKTKWRFKTRYSDLRDIHQALKEQQKLQLPEFPKRKIFGITNDDPQEIENRKKGLEIYLNQIYAYKFQLKQSEPELANSDILDYFIQNSRRESKKLQKFDEQKMLLKMKMKQKQQQQQQMQQLQQRLLNANTENDENKKDDKIVKPFRPISKRGLFIIKELLDKYEDDNTTLIRYSSLNSNPMHSINHLSVEVLKDTKLEAAFEKASSEPNFGQIAMDDLDYDLIMQNEEEKKNVQHGQILEPVQLNDYQ